MEKRAPNVNAGRVALPPDTRNYKFCKRKNCERSYENTFRSIFSIFLSLVPLIISAFNSCSALEGAQFAMELCCAQLRHGEGAMTARPHADRVIHKGSETEKPGMFSLKCLPVGVNSIKPNSLTNSHRPPSHTVPGLHCIEMLGGHFLFPNFPLPS